MNLYVIDPTEKLFKQFNTEKKSEFNTIFAHLLKSVTQKNLLTPGDFILADSDNAETWLKDVDLSKDIPAGVKLITTRVGVYVVGAKINFDKLRFLVLEHGDKYIGEFLDQKPMIKSPNLNLEDSRDYANSNKEIIAEISQKPRTHQQPKTVKKQNNSRNQDQKTTNTTANKISEKDNSVKETPRTNTKQVSEKKSVPVKKVETDVQKPASSNANTNKAEEENKVDSIVTFDENSLSDPVKPAAISKTDSVKESTKPEETSNDEKFVEILPTFETKEKETEKKQEVQKEDTDGEIVMNFDDDSDDNLDDQFAKAFDTLKKAGK